MELKEMRCESCRLYSSATKARAGGHLTGRSTSSEEAVKRLFCVS
jgi:hypothetical protein